MHVFSGEDTFESYNSAKIYAHKLAIEKAKEIQIINEDDIHSLNDLLYLTESIDIFGVSPVLFAKRILNNKEISTYFAENIEKVKTLDLVIWQDEELDPKTKIYKTLTLHNLLKNFPSPKAGEIKLWLKNKSKALEIKLTEDVLNFIIENVTTDKWILATELKKISLIDLKNPTIENVKEIFGMTVKGDIWNFIDLVGNRKKSKAVNELDKLTAYEDNTQLIISLLQREFKLIAQVIMSKNDKTQLSNLGIAPFILKKTQLKAKNFTIKEVQGFVSRLFNLDYAIKTGEIDDKIGLTLFLLTL